MYVDAGTNVRSTIGNLEEVKRRLNQRAMEERRRFVLDHLAAQCSLDRAASEKLLGRSASLAAMLLAPEPFWQPARRFCS